MFSGVYSVPSGAEVDPDSGLSLWRLEIRWSRQAGITKPQCPQLEILGPGTRLHSELSVEELALGSGKSLQTLCSNEWVYHRLLAGLVFASVLKHHLKHPVTAVPKSFEFRALHIRIMTLCMK